MRRNRVVTTAYGHAVGRMIGHGTRWGEREHWRIITRNGRSDTLTAVQSGVQFGRDEVEDRIRMVYERGSEEHARFN